MFRKKQIPTPVNLPDQTKHLDQLQALLDEHKSSLTEEEAWGFQANIDRIRFDVELNKLTAYRPK